tara:strand:+ start:854 stop:1648 length:795 start_codon:yes stop_codon:yes gene_type:complete
MATFNFIAEHTNPSSNSVDILTGNTSSRYQNMADATYWGKYTIDKKTGKVTAVGTASSQDLGSKYAMLSGGSLNGLTDRFSFQDDLTSVLINLAFSEAPFNNHHTSELQNIFVTSEFSQTLKINIIWLVRKVIDQSIGQLESGTKGAEMDIPVYRDDKLMISTVALGRMLGLSYNDLTYTSLGKFNHRVGEKNGGRDRWVGREIVSYEGTEISTDKHVRWQNRQNNMNVLNKFEVTQESIDALTSFIHNRLKNIPFRSLDNIVE